MQSVDRSGHAGGIPRVIGLNQPALNPKEIVVSHHLDSPASRKDSRLNVTDLYVFNGDTGTVLTMITNTSLAGDARAAGFHPEGRYEFRIHPDLAPVEQVTYRVTFGDPDDS